MEYKLIHMVKQQVRIIGKNKCGNIDSKVIIGLITVQSNTATNVS